VTAALDLGLCGVPTGLEVGFVHLFLPVAFGAGGYHARDLAFLSTAQPLPIACPHQSMGPRMKT
jgi:hypothetical protein